MARGDPAWMQRAWRRAADQAAAHEPSASAHKPPAATPADPDLPVLPLPEAVTEDGALIDGRPKRGRLPDPDDKGQRAAPPSGWYEGGFGRLPEQW